jgi:hypothetical protein
LTYGIFHWGSDPAGGGGGWRDSRGADEC